MYIHLNTCMLSFKEFFFTENRPGEKKSAVHTNMFKGAVVYDNGRHQQHKMTYDVNRAEPNEEEHIINKVGEGVDNMRVVTPKMVAHISNKMKNFRFPSVPGQSNRIGKRPVEVVMMQDGRMMLRRVS